MKSPTLLLLLTLALTSSLSSLATAEREIEVQTQAAAELNWESPSDEPPFQLEKAAIVAQWTSANLSVIAGHQRQWGGLRLSSYRAFAVPLRNQEFYRLTRPMDSTVAPAAPGKAISIQIDTGAYAGHEYVVQFTGTNTFTVPPLATGGTFSFSKTSTNTTLILNYNFGDFTGSTETLHLDFISATEAAFSGTIREGRQTSAYSGNILIVPHKPSIQVAKAIEVSWNAVSNRIYRVQWTIGDTNASWSDFANATASATGKMLTYDTALDASARRYRVSERQPELPPVLVWSSADLAGRQLTLTPAGQLPLRISFSTNQTTFLAVETSSSLRFSGLYSYSLLNETNRARLVLTETGGASNVMTIQLTFASSNAGSYVFTQSQREPLTSSGEFASAGLAPRFTLSPENLPGRRLTLQFTTNQSLAIQFNASSAGFTTLESPGVTNSGTYVYRRINEFDEGELILNLRRGESTNIIACSLLFTAADRGRVIFTQSAGTPPGGAGTFDFAVGSGAVAPPVSLEGRRMQILITFGIFAGSTYTVALNSATAFTMSVGDSRGVYVYNPTGTSADLQLNYTGGDVTGVSDILHLIFTGPLHGTFTGTSQESPGSSRQFFGGQFSLE